MLFKRIGAYLIDVILILLISSMIGNVLPNSKKVTKISKDSQDVLVDYYTALADGDTDVIIEYSSEINSLNYKLSKVSIPSNLILVGLYFLYFIVFQRYNNGQTLGKKLLKIEIISDEDEVSFKSLLIRGIILYPILFNLIDIGAILIFKEATYMNLSTWIAMAKYICFLCCFLPMVIGKSGLHDKLAKTRVIVVGSDEKEEGKATKWKKSADKEKEIKKYRVNHTSGKRKEDRK